jgi:uncharacterized protein (DUF3820 family)
MPDPWRVLYLHPDAPSEVVEAAYRALAKRLHPDSGGSTSAMAAVNSAYDAVRGKARGWKPPGPDEALEGLRAEVTRLRAENAALRAQPHRPAAADVRMGWGKHQGLPLSEVPADYLRWMTRQDWLDRDLADDIEDVLAWRRT